jgi:hypothetical protein
VTQYEYDLRVPIAVFPALIASLLSLFLYFPPLVSHFQTMLIDTTPSPRGARTHPHTISALTLCTYSPTIHPSSPAPLRSQLLEVMYMYLRSPPGSLRGAQPPPPSRQSIFLSFSFSFTSAPFCSQRSSRGTAVHITSPTLFPRLDDSG